MTTFPSKLLLFGEYAIIKGAQALAIPFSAYSGRWEYGDTPYNLGDFYAYLKELQKQDTLLTPLDLANFGAALSKGLHFQSSIPTGYGVGSSGALVAAVYHQYRQGAIEHDTLQLKKNLAQIESFFHGASSGIDPLVSFLKKGVWIKSKTTIQVLEKNPLSGLDLTFFLVDTQKSRQTAPLVEIFNHKYDFDPTFHQIILDDLINVNNQAILSFLDKKEANLFQQVHQISSIQLEHFQDMIPSKFQAIWKKGLESDLYKLKLCGAGGGGFILGMTPRFEETRQQLSTFRIQKVDTHPNPPILKRIF